jgi:pimeloyl-ACP methyl ester carboxylesterase
MLRIMLLTVFGFFLPALGDITSSRYGADYGAVRVPGFESREGTYMAPALSVKSMRKIPLIVLLHPWGTDATLEAFFLGFANQFRLAGREFVLLLPKAIKDRFGYTAWNPVAPPGPKEMTLAIVGPDNKPIEDSTTLWHFDIPDDIAFLNELIKSFKKELSNLIDAQRVYVVGHSSGGFMAHVFAAQHPESVTAMITIAGTLAAENPSNFFFGGPQAVSLLHIHALEDNRVDYAAGGFAESFGTRMFYADASSTVNTWLVHNGCDLDRVLNEEFQTLYWPAAKVRKALGYKLDDTMSSTYFSCNDGSQVAFWTLKISGQVAHRPLGVPLNDLHAPHFSKAGISKMLDFLFAHASRSQ